MVGEGCDRPGESCLVFGMAADFYVKNGYGRTAGKQEILQVLQNANRHGLVLQPGNAQTVSNICCCCGCCCGVLHRIQNQPVPAKAVASSFIASFDPEACAGCFTCLERCQMQALAEMGDVVSLNSDRCIGCGLCVTTCPSGALTLMRKPTGEIGQIPATMQEAWRTIANTQS